MYSTVYTLYLYISLWVLGRASAPRRSILTNTQLQRRRATPSDPTKKEKKKKLRIFSKQLRPGISTSLSTTDLCLQNTAQKWSAVCYYRICQLGPRNGTEYSLICICLCLAVWLCLKMGSEKMVLMRLLQIGANDLIHQTSPIPKE